MILRSLRPAVVLTAMLTLTTGVVYPAIVTLAARALFPDASAGSLVKDDSGRPLGSRLIGQSFTADRYFHSRPSAAGAGYDASASAGTNKGPTDRKLADTLLAGRIEALVTAGAAARGAVPADLVTASASGLDPHLSPSGAQAQVRRVAQARQVPDSRIAALVAEHTEGRTWGLLGEPRVNVLLLNLALDRLVPTTDPSGRTP